MDIKTKELQQLENVLGTDSVLLSSASAGTGRLRLDALARYMDGELLKSGTALSTALSNKADALKANVTLYVATSGSDTAGDGTEAAPFATIAKALSFLPKNLGGYTATVKAGGGTYTERLILLESFYGGTLILTGDAKNLDNEAIITNGLVVSHNRAIVRIELLHINGTSYGAYNLTISFNHFVRLDGVTFDDNVPTGLFTQYNNNIECILCTFSNKDTALIAAGGIFSGYVVGGKNNSVCIQSGSANCSPGIVICTNNSITGTVQYAKEYGGIIFADGVQV